MKTSSSLPRFFSSFNRSPCVLSGRLSGCRTWPACVTDILRFLAAECVAHERVGETILFGHLKFAHSQGQLV
jgi:hypothetical protein